MALQALPRQLQKEKHWQERNQSTTQGLAHSLWSGPSKQRRCEQEASQRDNGYASHASGWGTKSTQERLKLSAIAQRHASEGIGHLCSRWWWWVGGDTSQTPIPKGLEKSLCHAEKVISPT